MLIATLAALVLFALDTVSGGAVRAPVRFAGAELMRAANLGAADVAGSGIFATRAHLATENASLKTKLDDLTAYMAAAKAAQAENAQLRAFVHLATTTKGVTAPVLSSFRTSIYGTFLIGAGIEDGLQNGDLVLSPEGFVIGTVTDARAGQSLVTEIFASGSSLDALVGDVPITLTGKGGGYAMGSAPRGSAIASSSPAVAPALGDKPVGYVEHTEGDASSAAVTTYVRSPVNFSTLQFVYVEKR